MDNKNFDFSISIPPVITDMDSCLEMIKKTPFRILEIPGNWLESKQLTDRIEISEFHISGVTDLIAPSVSSSIADQKENIINGYIEKLIILTDQLQKSNTSHFSINPGLETSFTDQSKIDSRINLLKMLSPYLLRKQLKLFIPVRIPSVSTIPKGKYGSFLKDTMSPDIKIAMNIHPHEKVSHGKPEDIIKEFRFFIGSFTFVYEPETGNTLVDKIIDPWLQELDKINYIGPVIFRPRVSNIENLQIAINNLSELLKLN